MQWVRSVKVLSVWTYSNLLWAAKVQMKWFCTSCVYSFIQIHIYLLLPAARVVLISVQFILPSFPYYFEYFHTYRKRKRMPQLTTTYIFLDWPVGFILSFFLNLLKNVEGIMVLYPKILKKVSHKNKDICLCPYWKVVLVQ